MINDRRQIEQGAVAPSALAEAFAKATDMLGNPDDYRKVKREVQGVYGDNKVLFGNGRDLVLPYPGVWPFTPYHTMQMEVVPPDDVSDVLPKNWFLTVYRDGFLVYHSTADNLAFLLNQATAGNAYGKGSDLSFYGRTLKSNEVKKEFPDLTKFPWPNWASIVDYTSIVYLRQKLGRGKIIEVPLFSISRGPNFMRSDSDQVIDFSFFVQIMDGFKHLSKDEGNLLLKFLREYSTMGFPSMSNLEDELGRIYPNPIGEEGAIDPTKEFIESDPKAKKLRDQLVEIAVIIEYCFESRNQNLRLISLLDQKITQMSEFIREYGINLKKYKAPERLEIYRPFNFVVNIAWNVLGSLENFTNLEANYEDFALGRLDASEEEDESIDLGYSRVGMFSTASLSDMEKKIIIAQALINIMFHRLDIRKEEEQEIMSRLGL